jgi:hypothetical protein
MVSLKYVRRLKKCASHQCLLEERLGADLNGLTSSRSSTHFQWPFEAAQSRGVHKKKSLADMSAPAA